MLHCYNRRTKTTRADDINLPLRIVRVSKGRLDDREEDFYQALYTQSQAQFNTYVQSGTVLNNYAHIFDILIRLRQAVDHPYLVIYSDKQTSAMAAASNSSSGQSFTVRGEMPVTSKTSASKKQKKTERVCALCKETPNNGLRADCGHSFCRFCIDDYLQTVSSTSLEALAAAESGGKEGDDDGDDYGMAKKRKQPPKKVSGGQSKTKPSQSSSSSSSSSSGPPKAYCPECEKELTLRFVSAEEDEGDAEEEGDESFEEVVDQLSSGDDWPTQVFDSIRRKGKSILARMDLSLFQSSTKIEALMQELHLLSENDPGAKAIVFSQFVAMLGMLYPCLPSLSFPHSSMLQTCSSTASCWAALDV